MGASAAVILTAILALTLKAEGVVSVSDIPEASADSRTDNWQLQQIVNQLRTARDDWRTRNGRVSGEHGGRELP